MWQLGVARCDRLRNKSGRTSPDGHCGVNLRLEEAHCCVDKMIRYDDLVGKDSNLASISGGECTMLSLIAIMRSPSSCTFISSVKNIATRGTGRGTLCAR